MIRSIVSKIRRKLGLLTNQQGQGLTELAVITPILLLFFLGLVEVGGALHSYSAVNSAAREGKHGTSDAYSLVNRTASAAILSIFGLVLRWYP